MRVIRVNILATLIVLFPASITMAESIDVPIRTFVNDGERCVIDDFSTLDAENQDHQKELYLYWKRLLDVLYIQTFSERDGAERDEIIQFLESEYERINSTAPIDHVVLAIEENIDLHCFYLEKLTYREIRWKYEGRYDIVREAR
jgi:hypothetical protein